MVSLLEQFHLAVLLGHHCPRFLVWILEVSLIIVTHSKSYKLDRVVLSVFQSQCIALSTPVQFQALGMDGVHCISTMYHKWYTFAGDASRKCDSDAGKVVSVWVYCVHMLYLSLQMHLPSVLLCLMCQIQM